MGFYADMKIRSKLLIGFGALLCAAFAIGLFGYSQINLIQKTDTLMYEQGAIPLEHIGEIAANFQRVRTNVRELILAKDAKTTAYYEDRIAKFRAEINDAATQMDLSLPDADARKMFAAFGDSRSGYTTYLAKIISLCRDGKKQTAIDYMNSAEVLAAERAELNAIEHLQHYLIANAKKISESNSVMAKVSGYVMLFFVCAASLLAAVMAFVITRSVVNPLRISLDAVRQQEELSRERSKLVEKIAAGNLDQQVLLFEPMKIEAYQHNNDEAGLLLKSMVAMSEEQYLFDSAFVDMTNYLRNSREQEIRTDKQKNGMNELNKILSGDKTTVQLAEDSIFFLAQFLGAGSAVFYLADEKSDLLSIAASYAFVHRKRLNDKIRQGEGLVGQALLEKTIITLSPAPSDYLPIGSGIGEATPVSIIVVPITYETIIIGVLEFARFTTFNDNDILFIKQAAEVMGVAFNVNRSRQKVNDLLEQTKSQSEILRVQQEELQQTNEELEERAQMLEQQKEQIRSKNREVEAASHELELRAEELQRVSTYKSQFLANMSHELRTPLNSMMILSSLLKDNREGNLTEKQVEFAATINGAGRDLLNLINDILDLSKIEAGKLEFDYEDVALEELCLHIQAVFVPIAADKEIDFYVTYSDSAPERLIADGKRIQQILKNLIANACKFTSHGEVRLTVSSLKCEDSPISVDTIAFAVSDTGIGIPLDKQELIFNAFQQADGSTSRHYGGTGLGLSISRQLARSMGGEIHIQSREGEGSTFTLYLPIVGCCNIPEVVEIEKKQNITQINTLAAIKPKNKSLDPIPSPIPDDRDSIDSVAKSILIIEDDLIFAKILLTTVKGRGFAGMVAADGENGIALAEQYQPSAIILDVMLPHIDGWGVMRSLKDNPKTRHIPVHFITCLEERQKAMSMGAVGYVTKPVNSDQLDSVFSTLEEAMDRSMKMLLIVEDDKAQATAMVALLETRNVTIIVADTGRKAIELLLNDKFDCIVLDLGLADMGAFELLEELKKLDPERRIPVIIHTGRELNQTEEKKLRNYSESIIIKGAKSPERLLNEVTLFLHLVETSLDTAKQRMIRTALDKEAMLEGRKVLIVDDDMRNIFSLSSALSEKGILVVEAENGEEALKIMDKNSDIDLVLMDIMMPVMDGYETTRNIRKDARFKSIPIIALTAKAMKGDREECLNAGASDYIPKPVDMGKLFSLLRVWLYRAT